MATYSALISLAETIDQILNHHQHHQHHDTLPLLVKHQIICIHEYVTFLHLLLQHFPDKAKTIEGRIRDSANGAEDIIDKFLWRHTFFTKQLLHFQLQIAIEEFGFLAGLGMNIKTRNSRSKNAFPFGDAYPNPSVMRIEAPAQNREVLVGVHDDLLAIKERLCGGSTKLEIIPIVGMGGIGKTTLARNIYNDLLIKERFDICAWVTVSQDYGGIVSSLKESLKASSEEEVYQSLMGRRYLVVLDDIWSPQAWDNLRRLLPDDRNGSRVMLTTRLSDVAAYPDSSASPHDMHFMGEYQSWDLLRHRVFATTGEDCPRELEDIGCAIARSCKGLPLAIVLLAGVLSEIPRTKDSWESVAGHVNQVVAENMEEFANVVLSLSYNHLPQHLRPCFLYMGAFPEDHEIHVSKLIKLWVAEGFTTLSGSKTFKDQKSHDEYLEELVKRSLENFQEENELEHLEDLVKRSLVTFQEKAHEYQEDLVKRRVTIQKKEHEYVKDLVKRSLVTLQEEKAHEYLEDLAKRSLVFVVKRKTNGKIKSCSIHDLVRELCVRKAEEDKFLHRHTDAQTLTPRNFEFQHRRLSIVRHNLDCIIHNGSAVHSVICFQCDGTWLRFLRKLRLLRILDLVNNVGSGLHKEFIVLPDQVHELFHLRYLAFDYPINIPPLISNLQNLQTLIVHPRYGLENYGPCMVNLPSEIWRMPKLRHLVSFVFAFLPDPPEETLSCLDNLQTLTMVRNFILSEKLRTMIPNLNKLGISYHLEDEYVEDYRLRDLALLKQLEKLKIRIFAGFRFRTKLDPVFPKLLKKLTLSGTRLPWEETGAAIGTLPFLQVLKLRYHACVGDKWETCEEGFRQLKFLLIDVSNLSEWCSESSHFPRLRNMALYRCRKLSRIPEEIGEIPTLEAIWVDKSNAGLVESAEGIQKEQQDNGNDALQVHINEGNNGIV